jgi:hypothetical protein
VLRHRRDRTAFMWFGATLAVLVAVAWIQVAAAREFAGA